MYVQYMQGYHKRVSVWCVCGVCVCMSVCVEYKVFVYGNAHCRNGKYRSNYVIQTMS